jgi:hypothetical protein
MPQDAWTAATLVTALRKWTGWKLAMDAADMIASLARECEMQRTMIDAMRVRDAASG